MFGSPNAGNQQGAGAGGHGGWGSLAYSSGAGSNELQRSQYQTGYLMVPFSANLVREDIDASI